MGTESGLRRRVKGLSEAEFRQRFGTEAQCRAALFALRWGKGWACPGCGHGGYAELKGRAVYQCNRCKRQVGLTAGHGVPLDQAAADHLVSGDLPSEPEQGRDELGRAGAAARHPAADRLADQAQADGGDGRRARPRSPSWRAGSRSTTPISAGSARAASAAAVRPARRRSWRRSRRRPSASPGGCG